MKFSEQWLRQWVDLEGISSDELVHRLTMAGLEVDDVAPVAGRFENVVVGRITEVAPHPDADKLRVCSVDAGGDASLQIVCGAPNAREGMRAPVARVGAVLPGGLQIGAARLRGVASSGMLCSASELGLSDEAAGLMELPPEAPVGEDLRAYLGLMDDQTIDIDLTPNRADCLGLEGLAQDVAAIFGRSLTPLEVDDVPPVSDEVRQIRLEDPEDCPRYLGRVIRGIDATADTPLWISERLRRSGLRPISPVVDVTNYVLLELGQPLHAFDHDQLRGTVAVRRAREGETLTLLTEDEAKLDSRFLLITDESGPLAIGGVMGGLHSAVSDKTRNVFLESAWFRPATIVGRARDLGLHSDAAHRFERGVDPQLQRRAMERATRLLLDIAGGEPGPVVEVCEAAHLPQRKAVQLRSERIGRLLGTTVPAQQVEAILGGLGMEVEGVADGWMVTAPTRRFDIAIEEDLIEEVARIHGYDRLTGRIPEGAIPAVKLPEGALAWNRLRSALVDRGYFEAINYSFIGPEQLTPMDMPALPLANPLSADLAVMRTSLVAGLLGSLARNQHRQQARVRLFELGAAFPVVGDQVAEGQRLAAVCVGDALPEQWGQASRGVDFYDAKGDLEAILSFTGDATFRYQAASLDFLHPGQSAQIHRGETPVGWIGAVHPQWLERLEIAGPVFAFELDLDALGGAAIPTAGAISPFPSIRRDLAIIVEDRVRWQQIRDMVEETAGNLLTELVVFDEYRGPGIATGSRSVALGLILQDSSRTLTDADVDAVVESVVAGLRDRLNAVLRA